MAVIHSFVLCHCERSVAICLLTGSNFQTLWFDFDLYGNLLKSSFKRLWFIHIFVVQKSRRLGTFCSGGFQPTEDRNTQFYEFRRNETYKIRRSYGTQMLYHAIFKGLKPLATKLTEPMALEKKMCINRIFSKDNSRIYDSLLTHLLRIKSLFFFDFCHNFLYRRHHL